MLETPRSDSTATDRPLALPVKRRHRRAVPSRSVRPEEECPVKALIPLMEMTIEGMHTAEKNDDRATQESFRDRLYAIRDCASFLIPSSVEGALMLLAVAGDDVGTSYNSVFHLDSDAEVFERRIQRCIWAAMRYFESAGATLPPATLDYLAGRQCDPFENMLKHGDFIDAERMTGAEMGRAR